MFFINSKLNKELIQSTGNKKYFLVSKIILLNNSQANIKMNYFFKRHFSILFLEKLKLRNLQTGKIKITKHRPLSTQYFPLALHIDGTYVFKMSSYIEI